MPTFNHNSLVTYTRNAPGLHEGFGAIRAGVGTTFDATTPLAIITADFATIPPSTYFVSMSRLTVTFDTHTLQSLLDPTHVITDATLTINVLSKTDGLLLGDLYGGICLIESLLKNSSTNITKFNLSNLNFWSPDTLADIYLYSEIASNQPLVFTLNEDGINSIVTNGTSAFDITLNADLFGSASWVSSKSSFVLFKNSPPAVLDVTIGAAPPPSNIATNFASGIGYRRRRRPFNPASIDII